MNIGEICRRQVVTVPRSDDLGVAARLMREHHVGFLVVVQAASGAAASRSCGSSLTSPD